MKPAPFEYHRPSTISDALSLLANLGDDAKVLAGGQSLVPLMNFRLARPAALIDLNGLPELAYVREESGHLRIGAMTRQRQIERSPLVNGGWPLLSEATRYIGHTQIRNRGTIGGSLAHADPSAELPAVMAAVEAALILRNAGGERAVSAASFFQSAYTTELSPTELLAEVQLPAQPPRTGFAFQEISMRHGDFALIGVAALVTLDDGGLVSRCRLAFAGGSDRPLRAGRAETTLVGQEPSESACREASALAVADLDPVSDVHATAAYRRQVAGVIARRALIQAAGRARGTVL